MTGYAGVELGAEVMVEHPAGHRLVGTVRGVGTNGISLAVQGMGLSPYLEWSLGWSLVRPPETQSKPQPSRASLDVPEAYPRCGRCRGSGVLSGWQGRCPQCGGAK